MIDEYFHGYQIDKRFNVDDPSQIARLQASRIYTNKSYCDCPSSEKGIIKIDVSVHEPDCKLRKRLFSKGYIVETSQTQRPDDIDHGLGVAI